MNTINPLANSIAQNIEDGANQISYLVMLINAVIARMNSTSDNYRRLAVIFKAPLVWFEGIVFPQIFEEHQKSRKFFDTLSTAAFILSIAYLVIGGYFSITDDPYYLIVVFIIAVVVALLWHIIFRAASFRIFKLKPEKSEESRISWAEIAAVSFAIAGFAGALIFAIGRATGDETGFLADYFVESLFVSDGLLLTASGIAHSVADFYRWSENHCHSYENDRQQLFRLKEQISKLTALLSRDLKRFNQIEESARPPITLPAEVVEVLQEYEEKFDQNSAGKNPAEMDKTKDTPLLSDEGEEDKQ